MALELKNRRLALIGLGVGLLSAGCSFQEPDLEAPFARTLACQPAVDNPRSDPAISQVFALDSGDASVIWVDGPGAPEGRLDVEDHFYVFDFAGSAEALPVKARVNRYDGMMVREQGRSPIILNAPSAGVGNMRTRLRCVVKSEGSKL